MRDFTEAETVTGIVSDRQPPTVKRRRHYAKSCWFPKSCRFPASTNSLERRKSLRSAVSKYDVTDEVDEHIAKYW